jgi:hypothetical protein
MNAVMILRIQSNAVKLSSGCTTCLSSGTQLHRVSYLDFYRYTFIEREVLNCYTYMK